MNEEMFVFSSVGSACIVDHENGIKYQSLVFDSWDVKNYESGCVIYHENDFSYENYFKKVIKNKDYKFPNLFLYNQKYKIENKYIAVLDDDLLFDQPNTIKFVTEIMKKNNLHVCSICNNQVGRFSKGQNSDFIMGAKETLNELWITNFVEMGCMFLSSELLNIVQKKYFKEKHTIKDYGFDYFICSIAENLGFKMGVIKNLTFYNPHKKMDRDIGYHQWKGCESKIPRIMCVKKEAIELNF